MFWLFQKYGVTVVLLIYYHFYKRWLILAISGYVANTGPANTRRSAIVGLTLAQRIWRWIISWASRVLRMGEMKIPVFNDAGPTVICCWWACLLWQEPTAYGRRGEWRGANQDRRVLEEAAASAVPETEPVCAAIHCSAPGHTTSTCLRRDTSGKTSGYDTRGKLTSCCQHSDSNPRTHLKLHDTVSAEDCSSF